MNSKKVASLPTETGELTNREERLAGATYKIKPGASQYALYITINNQGGRPYEIFLNSKDPEIAAWTAMLSRLLSTLMRQTNDMKPVIAELKEIHDPKGGYFYKNLGFIPSLQAHIALVLEQHIG